MSETEPALEPVVTAWRAIAASHAAACAALEREMGKRHGLGVSEFEVLDRLEKDGLVERCLCGEDRRGIYVTLTPAGRDSHAEAAPTPREVLASVLPAELLAP